MSRITKFVSERMHDDAYARISPRQRNFINFCMCLCASACVRQRQTGKAVSRFVYEFVGVWYIWIRRMAGKYAHTQPHNPLTQLTHMHQHSHDVADDDEENPPVCVQKSNSAHTNCQFLPALAGTRHDGDAILTYIHMHSYISRRRRHRSRIPPQRASKTSAAAAPVRRCNAQFIVAPSWECGGEDVKFISNTSAFLRVWLFIHALCAHAHSHVCAAAA